MGRRIKIAIVSAAVVGLVFGAAAAPAHAWIWGRWRVLGWQALWGIDGQPIDRFQVITVVDGTNAKTCLAIVRDTQTAAFTTTAVDAGSCPQ